MSLLGHAGADYGSFQREQFSKEVQDILDEVDMARVIALSSWIMCSRTSPFLGALPVILPAVLIDIIDDYGITRELLVSKNELKIIAGHVSVSITKQDPYCEIM